MATEHDLAVERLPRPGRSVLLGDLTFAEVADAAANGALALVPTGCTEQQGPHLLVDFDTWMVSTVAAAAAAYARDEHAVDVLVAPTLPFGPTSEHRSFGSGYIDLPQPLHEAVISAVLQSLRDQGFRTIVVWRGCGGHDLGRALAAFNSEQQGCVAHQPELPYREIWLELGDARDDGGHADGFATSLALHLRPDSVRTDLIADPGNNPVDWNKSDLDAEASAGREPFRRWAQGTDGTVHAVPVGGCSDGFNHLDPALDACRRTTAVGASPWAACNAACTLALATTAILDNPDVTICTERCERCLDAQLGGPIIETT